MQDEDFAKRWKRMRLKEYSKKRAWRKRLKFLKLLREDKIKEVLLK